MPPHITSPTSGTIIALDPVIPPNRQRVSFDTQGTNLRWRMDGKPFAKGPSPQWLPWPSRHVVQLGDTRGTVLDEIRLEVRGAGVKADQAGGVGKMTHYLKPKQAKVLANGDLVISRLQDGHFYTTGRINGQEAKFLVDTGASLVSVSEGFARKAFIRGGVPTTFKTANGDRPGEGVGVSIGPVSVTNVKVGVGLHVGAENDALLGQSFLSKFDITMNKNQMVLRLR